MIIFNLLHNATSASKIHSHIHIMDILSASCLILHGCPFRSQKETCEGAMRVCAPQNTGIVRLSEPTLMTLVKAFANSLLTCRVEINIYSICVWVTNQPSFFPPSSRPRLDSAKRNREGERERERERALTYLYNSTHSPTHSVRGILVVQWISHRPSALNRCFVTKRGKKRSTVYMCVCIYIYTYV